ncbi:MAG: ATP-dependent DNA helicase [Polyangiales bacterium]
MGELGERAAAALGAEGAIARGLASAGFPYEPREGQLEMARAVGEAIENDRVLLCEAGTGTGKTLAYLVPALLSGRRVVVSTATKALQEQIYAKDLPLLADHLGVPFRAALMKGLSNYLCLRRLREALVSPDIPSDRRSTIARIEAWARESGSGDRVELSFLRDDDPAWRDVQSGSDTRIGQSCEHHDRCFITKMRDEAQRARLVVVNHHLYLADLALRRGGSVRGKGVIPEHDVVIFDEAHQLEEIATDFFGVRVSSARVDTIGRDAKRTVTALKSALGNETDSALARIDAMVLASQSFFATLARDLGSFSRGEGEARARLPEGAWTEELVHRRGRLDAALEALARWASLKERGDAGKEELAVLARRATAVRDDLVRIASPGREDVPWIEIRARSCAIGISPIDLAPVFRDELFATERDWPRTSILTSATLATEGRDPFLHAKRRLGLAFEVLSEDDDGAPIRSTRASCATSELVVPSPFDFAKNAGVYVPVDLPEPNDATFVDRAGSRVLDLIKASRGGAFILCASARNMRALHAILREAELPWPLLCQGERPKFALLNDFREAGNAILVATMGFWEGVDVPGRALRLVVIDKLPFAVPTDPVVAARHRAIEEDGRSSFAELSVPEAAISLKQGFGRLIRTRADAGVVAILDKRLRTKGYGRSLRASLPPASPLFDLAQVQAFFDVVVHG